MPVMVTNGEYTPKPPVTPVVGLPWLYCEAGTTVVPGSVAAVAVHTVPGGVTITSEVALLTLAI